MKKRLNDMKYCFIKRKRNTQARLFRSDIEGFLNFFYNSEYFVLKFFLLSSESRSDDSEF